MIKATKPFSPPIEDYISKINEIFENNWFTNHGPLVTELEQTLKEYFNVPFLVLVTNGTIALQIAIKALELKGEIITTVYDKHITRVTMDLKHAAIDYDNWISYNRIPFKKIGDYSLKDIAAYCNVINPKAHSALNDAKTTALCYKRLLGMKRY